MSTNSSEYKQRLRKFSHTSHDLLSGDHGISLPLVKEALQLIPEKEMWDFIQGMRAVFNILHSNQPDFVFIPYRGAAPLQWVLEVYYELEGVPAPEFVWLPVGTGYDLETKKQSGFSTETKIYRRVITKNKVDQKETSIQMVWKTLKQLYPDLKEGARIALLDEVQTGSTFTTNSLLLANTIDFDAEVNSQNIELFLISVINRNSLDEYPRTPQFQSLVAGNIPRKLKQQDVMQSSRGTITPRIRKALFEGGERHIPAHQVELPLSTVDLIPLLPGILRQKPEERQQKTGEDFWQYELQEPLENGIAASILKKITEEIILTGESSTHQEILAERAE